MNLLAIISYVILLVIFYSHIEVDPRFKASWWQHLLIFIMWFILGCGLMGK